MSPDDPAVPERDDTAAHLDEAHDVGHAADLAALLLALQACAQAAAQPRPS